MRIWLEQSRLPHKRLLERARTRAAGRAGVLQCRPVARSRLSRGNLPVLAPVPGSVRPGPGTPARPIESLGNREPGGRDADALRGPVPALVCVSAVEPHRLRRRARPAVRTALATAAGWTISRRPAFL